MRINVGQKDKRPHLKVRVGGKPMTALVDTGAATTCMSEEKFLTLDPCGVEEVDIPFGMQLSAANGKSLELKGRYFVEMELLGQKIKRPIFVIEGLGGHEMIIGIDLINELHMTIYQGNCMLPSEWQDKTTTAHVKGPTTLAAASIGHVKCQLRSKGMKPGQKVLIQAIGQAPFAWEGIQTIDKNGEIIVVLGNTTRRNLLLEPRLPVATVEVLEDQDPQPATDWEIAAMISSNMGGIKRDPKKPSAAPAKPLPPKEREEFEKKLNLKCPDKWREKYLQLCMDFNDVFSKNKFDLGRCGVIEHSIRLRDEEPVHVKQFPLPHAHREVADEWVLELLAQGAIEVSRSAYNSPVFFVKKASGGLRAVLDFRELNQKSMPDRYVIREIRECIDEVGANESKVFSAIDLTSGFWQQVLEKKSRQFTAFTVPGGARYQWCVTPMGLQGSPASFARLMDHVVRGLKEIIAYIDDVLAHSKDHEGHLLTLRGLFMRFRQFNLKIQPAKSIFGAKELQYLGYKLSEKGVGPGTEKLKAVKEFPCPTSIKKIREFVGLASYFRFLIKDFARNAALMTKLLKKDSGYVKGEMPPESKEGFEYLKTALCLNPIVQHPAKNGKWHLTTDASQGDKDHPGGMGAVLSQIVEGQERVIAYASRSLKKFEDNYSAYLLEMAAAEWAIDYFHVYLKGRHFELFTDHKPLLPLSTVHKKTLRRLQQQMLEHDFTLNYKTGESNVVADALSRNPVAVLSDSSGTLQEAQEQDQLCCDIRKYRSTGELPGHNKLYAKQVADTAKECKDEEGILYYWLRRPNHRTRWVVVAPEKVRHMITEEAHNSWHGGHGGQARTANRIMQSYFWPGLNYYVQKYVSSCPRCQTKAGKKTPPAPLCSLPICEGPNERVHMDLFGPLKSRTPEGNKYVIVMTDAYTKVVELDAIPDKTAETVAKAFFEKWICRYSVPIQLVTDQGREFCNQVLDGLCELLGIKHRKTTAYRPQTNSSAESFNRSMKKYLTAMLDNTETLDWEAKLAMLQFSYNCHVHRSTMETPFFLTYLHDPRLPWFDLENPRPLYNAEAAPALFQSLSETHKMVHQEQWKAKELREEYYNRKAKERHFDVGDRVLFYSTATPRNVNEKFYKHWQGPYIITRQLSPLNYEIKKGPRDKALLVHVDKLRLMKTCELQAANDSKKPDTKEEESAVEHTQGEMITPAGEVAHAAKEGDAGFEQKTSDQKIADEAKEWRRVTRSMTKSGREETKPAETKK